MADPERIALLTAVVVREHGAAALGHSGGDDRITAMGWYLWLFSDWRPEPVATSILLVRATEPLASRHGRDYAEWRSSWPLPHDVADVEGNHFRIMEDFCDATADAVDRWNSQLPPPGKEGL